MYIKKIKRKFPSNLYKANIVSVGKHFLEKSFKSGWNGLKKLAKPRYSSTQQSTIKDKNEHDLMTPSEQLKRWAEHYEDLASDVTGHSLNRAYWKEFSVLITEIALYGILMIPFLFKKLEVLFSL